MEVRTPGTADVPRLRGALTGMQFNLVAIAAILTSMGYSIDAKVGGL